jgi:glycosyltransferase involved in cell wall biosynthesis
MKVLFTTPMLLHPAASGPHLRIENSIKALGTVSDVHLISRVPSHQMGGERAVQFYTSLVKAFHHSPSVKNLSSKRFLRRVHIVVRSLLHDDAKYIVNYAYKHKIKIIWFGYGNLSYPLIKRIKKLAPNLKLICDTDSVWSRFLAREVPFIKGAQEKERVLSEAQKKELEEKAWVELCDVTTAVSDVDAEYYQGLTKNKAKVALFSNVLDMNSYHKVKPLSSLKKPAIYLAGSFGKATSAMNRAAEWLLHEILPAVKKHIPHIHCYIVGSHSDLAFGNLKDPNVTVTGRVESVLPILQHVDVALTPLQFESGTRFKILEAGACKIPMVSTTLGAEGLPVEHEEHILLADDTQNFAKAIVRLIENESLAQKLAQNAYDLVKSQYSLHTLENEAKSILQKVAS